MLTTECGEHIRADRIILIVAIKQVDLQDPSHTITHVIKLRHTQPHISSNSTTQRQDHTQYKPLQEKVVHACVTKYTALGCTDMNARGEANKGGAKAT